MVVPHEPYPGMTFIYRSLHLSHNSSGILTIQKLTCRTCQKYPMNTIILQRWITEAEKRANSTHPAIANDVLFYKTEKKTPCTCIANHAIPSNLLTISDLCSDIIIDFVVVNKGKASGQDWASCSDVRERQLGQKVSVCHWLSHKDFIG